MNSLTPTSWVRSPRLTTETLGLDGFFNDPWFEAATQQQGYPPYNISKNGEIYTIDLAVAGFESSQILVTQAGNKLTIEGNQENVEIDADTTMLHQGISARKFRREFMLAEHLKVETVNLENGILSVIAENVVPEELLPKTFKITNG
tara:strand:+ start:189 stop:629 length:441 start_codon:yes stop_codon:yes gene_type:complete